jgi:hypothetical protein
MFLFVTTTHPKGVSVVSDHTHHHSITDRSSVYPLSGVSTTEDVFHYLWFSPESINMSYIFLLPFLRACSGPGPHPFCATR